MRFPNLPDTEHRYKGFIILGRTRPTEGGYVLGGRFFVEGGIRRNYHVLNEAGKYVWSPKTVIEKLKYAKEQIDDYLKRKSEGNE